MNLKLGNEKEKKNNLDNMSPLEKANALMNDNDDFGEFGDSNIDGISNANNNSNNGDNYNNNNQYSDLKEPNIIGLDSDNDNNNNSTNANQNNNNSNNFSIFGDSDDDDDILNSLSGGLNLQDAIKEKAEKDNKLKENDLNKDSDDSNKNSDDNKSDNKKSKKEKKVKNKSGFNIYRSLTEKITGMGYSYSMISLLKTIFFFSFIIIIFGYFHKLKFIYIAILILMFLFLIPFSVYYQYKYLYEQKRFNQLKTYLKFMRLNFKQYKKIIIALKETKENFSEEDQIYFLIEDAINAIESGEDFRTALDIVEVPFKNSYITKLHSYIILAETEGGASALEALDTIDFENWESDTYIFQTQKYKYQNQNALYTLIGLAISLAIIFIFTSMMKDESTVDVFGNIFAQTSFQLITFFYILIDLISFIMIKSMITGKWVKEDE